MTTMQEMTITLTGPAKIGGTRYREGAKVTVSAGMVKQLRRDGLVRDTVVDVAEMVREGVDRARLRELEAENADLKRQLAEARASAEAPPAQPPTEPDPDPGASLDDDPAQTPAPTKRPRTKAG
ncbi:hypothetical protein P7L78_09185 [Tistrella bauzanensis]|uniref:hypothetical protein n=1 Tax=Tistrella TaxID=171436 RepID=UPI0031F63E9D